MTYYALADYYRDLLGRMGFAAEVEAIGRPGSQVVFTQQGNSSPIGFSKDCPWLRQRQRKK
jgi:hypothetical protein